MTNPPEDTLLKVAERVSDGNPVDWEATVKLHTESLETLEQLRLLAALADAHQRVRPHRTTSEPGPPQPARSPERPEAKPSPFSSSPPTSPRLWLAWALAAALAILAGWYFRRFFD